MHTKSLHPRTFGRMFTALLFIMSVILFKKQYDTAALITFIAGMCIFIIAQFSPQLLTMIQKPWERVTQMIATVITTIILWLVYYLFITPYVLILRACKVRFLKKFPAQTSSFWIKRPSYTSADPFMKYRRPF